MAVATSVAILLLTSTVQASLYYSELSFDGESASTISIPRVETDGTVNFQCPIRYIRIEGCFSQYGSGTFLNYGGSYFGGIWIEVGSA